MSVHGASIKKSELLAQQKKLSDLYAAPTTKRLPDGGAKILAKLTAVRQELELLAVEEAMGCMAMDTSEEAAAHNNREKRSLDDVQSLTERELARDDKLASRGELQAWHYEIGQVSPNRTSQRLPLREGLALMNEVEAAQRRNSPKGALPMRKPSALKGKGPSSTRGQRDGGGGVGGAGSRADEAMPDGGDDDEEYIDWETELAKMMEDGEGESENEEADDDDDEGDEREREY